MRLAFNHDGAVATGHRYHPGIYYRTSTTPRFPISGVGGTYDDQQQEPSLTQQITGSVIAGATTGAEIAIALGGSTKADIIGAVAAGLIASAPIPVVGPFLAAVGTLMGPIAVMFKGCGQTCVQAAEYANHAADALNQIKTLYLNQPVRYHSQQQAALQAVINVVNWIKQACGNPALGAAGQRCLSERVIRGAQAPWCPTSDHAGCDIWSVYYDPIANDPGVVPDPPEASLVSGSGLVSSVNVAGMSFPLPLLLIGGGVLVMTLVSD